MVNDNYSLKEMIQELRGEQKEQTRHTAIILTTLENIDKHLANLNSKVASHEKRFSGLETFQTKVMTVWGIAIFIIVTAINKLL